MKTARRSELLSQHGPETTPIVTLPFPGHSGDRPNLSFVLDTLHGTSYGLVQFHLFHTGNLMPEEQGKLEIILALPEVLRAAENEMMSFIKLLSDLWIDSGRNGDTDNPSTRNVEFAPEGRRAPIRGIFYNLVGNLVHYPAIRLDGTQDPRELVFGMSSEDFGWRSPQEAALRFGEKVAMYWFARFLNSKYSRHLTRCDGCGDYFAYTRAPKTDIKHGVYCDECKSIGSAKRLKSSRAMLHDEMVKAAAALWDAWKPTHAHPDRGRWIATQVSKQFKKRLAAPVTRKWVSQNLIRIETEIEKLVNMKDKPSREGKYATRKS